MSVLSDRDIRAAIEAGDVASIRTSRGISSRRRSTSTSTAVPGLPQQPVRLHRVRSPQPDLTELLRSTTTSRSSSTRRVRPGPDARVGRAARTTSSRRLEGQSSLGRLGLLIHSTAGYVDPGWKGNLTLELSNVANLPIALYFGMRIGQISFFRMSSPVERPYGSPELGSKYQGQSEPTASAFHRDFDAAEPPGPDGPRRDVRGRR